MLRFRDLGASFSRFGCFVFEFWVLRFRDRVLRFRVLGASFSRFGCILLRSSFSSASFSKLLCWKVDKRPRLCVGAKSVNLNGGKEWWPDPE